MSNVYHGLYLPRTQKESLWIHLAPNPRIGHFKKCSRIRRSGGLRGRLAFATEGQSSLANTSHNSPSPDTTLSTATRKPRRTAKDTAATATSTAAARTLCGTAKASATTTTTDYYSPASWSLGLELDGTSQAAELAVNLASARLPELWTLDSGSRCLDKSHPKTGPTLKPKAPVQDDET